MAHGQLHHADAAPPLTDKSTISDVAPKQQVFDQAIAGEKSANDWAQLKDKGSKSADNSLPAVEIYSGGKTVFDTLENTPGRLRFFVLDEPKAHEPAHNGKEKSHQHKPYDRALPVPQLEVYGILPQLKGEDYDNAIAMPQPEVENYDHAIPMPQREVENYDHAIAMPQREVENYDNAIAMPQPEVENYDHAIPMPQPKVHNKSIEHK